MHFNQFVEQGFKWFKEIASSATGNMAFETLKTGWKTFARKNVPGIIPDVQAEAIHASLVAQLPEDKRRPITDWLYELDVAVPNGPSHRQQDHIQSMADIAKAGQTAEEKKANVALAVETLRYLAELPSNDERTKAAVGLLLMREKESDYRNPRDWARNAFTFSEADGARIRAETDQLWAQVGQNYNELTSPFPSVTASVFTWIGNHGYALVILTLVVIGLSWASTYLR